MAGKKERQRKLARERLARQQARRAQRAHRWRLIGIIVAACCAVVLLGGADGLRYASEAASSFLSQGGVGAPDWRARAAAVHAAFVTRRLSPGGCADLLAMTLFVDELESGASQR